MLIVGWWCGPLENYEICIHLTFTTRYPYSNETTWFVDASCQNEWNLLIENWLKLFSFCLVGGFFCVDFVYTFVLIELICCIFWFILFKFIAFFQTCNDFFIFNWFNLFVFLCFHFLFLSISNCILVCKRQRCLAYRTPRKSRNTNRFLYRKHFDWIAIIALRKCSIVHIYNL